MKNGVLSELERIIGAENISDEINFLFRKDVQRGRLFIVRPGNVEEIQDIMNLANEKRINVFTRRGRIIPDYVSGRSGIIVDLCRMDEIIDIDEKNMKAQIQAGVTFDKLSDACAGYGMRILNPISAISPYVLRSYLDRDPLLGAVCTRSNNLSVFYAVCGNAEIWGSGSLQLGREGRPDFAEDQGPQISHAFRGSEDIFGIPFRATVYIYPDYVEKKALLAGFESLADALQAMKILCRNEHCFACLAADSSYLSSLLTVRGMDYIEHDFSPWNLFISIEHEKDIVDMTFEIAKDEICSCGGKIMDEDLAMSFLEGLNHPIYRFDYDSVLGDSHVVQYYCYPRNAETFFKKVEERIGGGYKFGRVIVPIHWGSSFFCEAVIYCSPDEFSESGARAFEAYKALLEEGALVDRLSGKLARLVFSKADESYIDMLKTLKDFFDPCGILNPDALI